MGRRHEYLAEEIFLPHRHPGAATAAAALRAIGRKRHALDVAAMAHRHDHVFALNELFDIGLEFELLDDRATRGAELILHRAQLFADHLHEPRARAEDFEVALDLDHDAVELLGDLVALERRQALQAKIEDRPRL